MSLVIDLAMGALLVACCWVVGCLSSDVRFPDDDDQRADDGVG